MIKQIKGEWEKRTGKFGDVVHTCTIYKEKQFYKLYYEHDNPDTGVGNGAVRLWYCDKKFFKLKNAKKFLSQLGLKLIK